MYRNNTGNIYFMKTEVNVNFDEILFSGLIDYI